jgi:transcriptional antiterminator NusG
MTEIENNTEATPNATPEVIPEAIPEVTPEVTPEATPEVTPEATPEATPEVTPEVIPEISTETVSETTTDLITEDAQETLEPSNEEFPQTQEGMNWFVLRVASNKEDFVRNALEKKVQIEGVQGLIGRIMVPTEKTKTLSKNKKVKITETKLYPGYIFVEMKLVDARISQDVFFIIKETTGVGDFVGTAGKPTPMSDEEVDKMLYDSQAPEEVTEVKLEFAKGDHVNVKDGPFMGYEGTVDEIFPDKGVVRVLATVFGRQTQIDIEYWMIEKAD